jgi:hypothetical protein
VCNNLKLKMMPEGKQSGSKLKEHREKELKVI